MQCIFCHKDASLSRSVEHIIPESLGNKHHFLPKGYVCDNCNNYFSVKIENKLLTQPYFVSMRFRNEILTKKGKFVKENMFFPEVTKSCEVIMESSDSGPIMSFYDEELYDLIAAGKTHTMIGLYLPEPEFPNIIMSRFLAKCAYEFFLYNVGRDNYDLCVHELLGEEHDILKDLREYARYGKGKYWQYNQRRLYSEGDIFLNQKENSYYEILHEMKFFVKDHKRYPNGDVEAEIYYVLAIAGIEYAICLSDPDISEYQKWVMEHSKQSPLKDDNETYIFGLSDSNPLLIKQCNDELKSTQNTAYGNIKLKKMNRLVLIGNGFDIAHGLKTNYADFINWYWEEWGRRLMASGNKSESDEFCHFILNAELGLGAWYLVRDWYFQNINLDAKSFIERAKKDRTLCEFLYNHDFFERINKSIETKRWVDIEVKYYKLLLETLEVKTNKKVWLPPKALNDDLDSLKNKLIEYLKLESGSTIATIEDIRDKIYRPIKEKEIAVANKKMFEAEDNHEPTNIMLLNFNYTSTPEYYMECRSNITINYIHGRLDNPQSVIFGYGDELDENYKRLKEQNDSECMRHVKSIRYQEHDNYRRMLEFIESDPFQVVIMGHSCGNSDRTLLNTIFEHPNCVSIKPYYYQKDDGSDNYNELVMNISRNFTDMKLMRDRVVCKDYCEPLTGVKPGVKVLG